MSERDKAIGQNVAAYRAARSQQWLADAMRARGHKWSQATVWGVEKGERPLRLTEAVDVAEILEVRQLDMLQLSRVESDLQVVLRAMSKAGMAARSATYELLRAQDNLRYMVEFIAHADQGRFIDDVMRQEFLDARGSEAFKHAQVMLEGDALDELVATVRLDWEHRNQSGQMSSGAATPPRAREGDGPRRSPRPRPSSSPQVLDGQHEDA